MTTATRQRKFRAAQTKRGLVLLRLWVTEREAELLRDLAAKLAEGRKPVDPA